ncbi:MAG TPA: hypothetical protein VFZ59_00770 [Verrucomicrobiae bacterium]|nr:hypothetical protein [Verrucomicrobiae bacterium]
MSDPSFNLGGRLPTLLQFATTLQLRVVQSGGKHAAVQTLRVI